MRVIAKAKLREFWERHRDAEAALKIWYAEASDAQWQGPQDILKRYPSADILFDNRVVFNLKGNQYRLVVQVHYNTGIVFIRFIGTHAAYNKINAGTI